MTALKLVARSPQTGADTLVWLATSPDVADVSGKYFLDREQNRRAPRVRTGQRRAACGRSASGSARHDATDKAGRCRTSRRCPHSFSLAEQRWSWPWYLTRARVCTCLPNVGVMEGRWRRWGSKTCPRAHARVLVSKPRSHGRLRSRRLGVQAVPAAAMWVWSTNSASSLPTVFRIMIATLSRYPPGRAAVVRSPLARPVRSPRSSSCIPLPAAKCWAPRRTHVANRVDRSGPGGSGASGFTARLPRPPCAQALAADP